MLSEVPLTEQLGAVEADPNRVLVVGAGVAGVTLAQLLRRQGLHPVLVDRAAPGADTGYMIALFPLADPVLDALGVAEEYRAGSVPMRRYRIRNRRGRTSREYSLSALLDIYGSYRGLDRGTLLDVLAARGGAVSHQVTVGALRSGDATVHATLQTPGGERSAEFDLVVAADGLHSGTRSLIVPDTDVSELDTGWGGWVGWIPADDEQDLGEELWGSGFFVGSYPVGGRIGVFVGGPRAMAAEDPAGFAERIRHAAPAAPHRVGSALRAITGPEAYFWSLTDCRTRRWANGRTVLLGDAAAGFLPTAGIGAGMAMESAWVLGTMLQGAGAEQVGAVLSGFERAQRPRVESAQQNSRRLATLMFHESRAVAFLRDLMTPLVPLGVALGPIKTLLGDPPAPVPVIPAPTS